MSGQGNIPGSQKDTDSSPLEAPAASPQKRIPSLDVLRGIAIIGTLASNIWLFTAGIGSSLPGWGESILLEISSWIPDGKFLGLLTIMFGIGLEIQRQSAPRANRKWPGKYPIRAGLLFLDGMINYIFIVQFDVLRAYAFTGLIVAFLLLTSERVQWWLIGVFLGLHLLMMTASAVLIAAFDPRRSSSERSDSAGSGDAAYSSAGGFNAGSTDYWQNLQMVLNDVWSGFSFGSEFQTIVIMGIAIFLLGSKLYRIGIFDPARRRLRLWIIALGFGVALPLDFLLGVVFSTYGTGQFARYTSAVGVSLGILALVAHFYQKRPLGWVGEKLASVGRMALSCYLIQNILGILLMYNFVNTGLLGGVDQVFGTYAAFAIISIILVVFSVVWLRYFKRGPFELAWNWSYRRLSREA